MKPVASRTDDTAVHQPAKKQKVRRKHPPTDNHVVSVSEGPTLPSPMAASVHRSGDQPNGRIIHQAETSAFTLSQQMQFNLSAGQLPNNIFIPETGQGPTRSVIPYHLHPFGLNETRQFGGGHRSVTESMSVPSLPAGSSSLNYTLMPANRRFGSLNYSSSFGPHGSPHLGTILPNLMEQQLMQGLHAADMLRSRPIGSTSNSANYFGFQDTHLATASPQGMVMPNISNSNAGIGRTSPCQLHGTASRILNDLLRRQHASLPQNPDLDALLGLGNGGTTSMEQQTSSGLSSPPAIQQRLPATLGQSGDILRMNDHQAYLRQQIEVFEATQDDLNASTRGRNKRIHVGQVGIRCRHCAHIEAWRRQSGTSYFPATIHGLYQAAQNMSTNHIQCGLCREMPDSVKTKFVELWPTRSTVSKAGARYWEEEAKRLGLVDTDNGIEFRPSSNL